MIDIETTAMAYDVTNEPNATEDYIKYSDINYTAAWIVSWMNKIFPECGYSTDGLIFREDGEVSGILEIKCHYILKDVEFNKTPAQKKKICPGFISLNKNDYGNYLYIIL